MHALSFLNRPNQNAYVVAEAEINHNGNCATALKMVETAKDVGADAIKFQYIVADEIATPGSTYYGLFKSVEFKQEDYRRIFDLAREVGIDCFLTVPSLGTLPHVLELGPPFLKVGSTNLTNLPLLEGIGKARLPVLLSTGLGTLGEIEAALNALDSPSTPVGLYHCTVQYPALMPDLNLKAIETLRAAFPMNPIGYSDHTEGEWAAIAALALGAVMFEKHFTLDRSQQGPDHAFSSDPKQFARYIEAIRATEAALGDGIKQPAPAEIPMIRKARRFVVTARPVKRGAAFGSDDLTCRRGSGEGEGVEPAMLSRMLGIRAPRDYAAGETVTWDDFRIKSS